MFSPPTGKTKRPLPLYFGRPVASVVISLASPMPMFFCFNWGVLSCASKDAGFLCPSAQTCRCAIKPSCRNVRTYPYLYRIGLSWSQRPNSSLHYGTLLPHSSGHSRIWYGVDLSWSQCPNLSRCYKTLLQLTSVLSRTWYRLPLLASKALLAWSGINSCRDFFKSS